MNNLTYLQSMEILDKETQQRCLAVMEKYGKNHWWEPDVDPRVYGYYQLKEPIMLMYGERFRVGLYALLERTVSTYELVGSAYDALCEEADRAWRWGVGCTSDEERGNRLAANLKRVASNYPENIVVIDPRSREDV